jgi:hypothetical protein
VQHLRLAQVVALNHIAQQHHVHIGAQEFKTVAGVKPLRLREAAKGEVIAKVFGKLGIPVDRDRSFRFIVTGDSGSS